MKYNLNHITDIANSSVGVLPREALLMYAIVKMMCPRTILEFGFAKGYSANNFLESMPADCKLYSFDPSTESRDISQEIKDSRFKFIFKKGEEIVHSDIENRFIDILFLDTSHEFISNVRIFKKVKKYLADDCVIMVHDTGLFNKDFMVKEWDFKDSFYVTEKGYAHKPQERLFVNYLKGRYPEFDQIHFHNERTECMGMTFLKKYKKLSLSKKSFHMLTKIYAHQAALFIPSRSKKQLKSLFRWK